MRRLAFIGLAPPDADETRAQNAAPTLAAASVTVLAVIWVGTYWVLARQLQDVFQFQPRPKHGRRARVVSVGSPGVRLAFHPPAVVQGVGSSMLRRFSVIQLQAASQ